MATEISSEAQESASERRSRTAWEWARFIVTLALLAILARSLVVAPFNIPSRSMTPAMMVGDYLFVAKWPYGYSRYSFPLHPGFIEGRVFGGRPERGDIVIFKSSADDATDYVKRVIGLPGDRVRLLDGQVIINGAPVPRVRVADYREALSEGPTCDGRAMLEIAEDGERFCRTPRFRETLPNGVSYETLDIGDTLADTTPQWRVPAGHYFMLGDDRDRSADSRFVASVGGGVGMVPEENLVGRALVVFWSTDGTASWTNPASWFRAARWDRIGKTY